MSIKIEAGLLYTKHDEWIRVAGDEATIGVSDYAQDALSDIVYLELPEPGETFSAEEEFGVVESVKASSELYMPVSGEVTAINEDLLDEPEKINSDPYGAAWLVKIKLSDASELDGLMDAAAYQTYCDGR
ncbi:MAG: glycine cleavage system protein GcvH [Anaerolineales bacterium]|nr:glycine cleavage system protein GcvH [Anaerolineales bacterium]